jgi:hypothetical protein
MNTSEVLPTLEALRAWDWFAELKRQDRPLTWLARKTGTHYQTVYRYGAGAHTPAEWLAKVAEILDWKGPDAE